MAIKGLTDRGLSFPEIGSIRKGAKKNPAENRPGADLKYFRVDFAEGETESATRFMQLYPEPPKRIKIMLPFNEIERTWDPYLEAYTAGRMVARSDGETYLYRQNLVTGQVTKGEPYVEDEPAGYDYNGKPVFCKPVGRLKVIIRELKRAAYLTVHTTSIHDIVNISSQLAAFKELNGGRLAGIPLILSRYPKEISTPAANGQRARRVKYLLSIEADPEWVGKVVALLETGATPALPSGEVITNLPGGEQYEADPDPDEADQNGDYTETEAQEGKYYPDDETGQLAMFEQPKTTMAIEFAESMTTSDGKRYGDMDNETLEKMLASIDVAIKNNHMTAKQRETADLKRDAVLTIKLARAQQPA